MSSLLAPTYYFYKLHIIGRVNAEIIKAIYNNPKKGRFCPPVL